MKGINKGVGDSTLYGMTKNNKKNTIAFAKSIQSMRLEIWLFVCVI